MTRVTTYTDSHGRARAVVAAAVDRRLPCTVEPDGAGWTITVETSAPAAGRALSGSGGEGARLGAPLTSRNRNGRSS